jgi:hypothetical protein
MSGKKHRAPNRRHNEKGVDFGALFLWELYTKLDISPSWAAVSAFSPSYQPRGKAPWQCLPAMLEFDQFCL